MIRTITEHHRRRTVDLSGIWDFAFLGDSDIDSVRADEIHFDDGIPVPGCFDATPRYAGKRGLAAYRRKIRFDSRRIYRFTFNGVHHWCRVLLVQEGTIDILGDHVGGFTVFHFDITRHTVGDAELIVLVDNRFDTKRCPTHLEYFDWYHYGGITRGAEVAVLGSCRIDTLHIETLDYETRRMSFKIVCRCEIGADTTLEILIDGSPVSTEPVTFHDGEATIETEIILPGAELWTPENSTLHTAEVIIGDDDRIERFGIRQVTVRDGKILINDRPVTLLGFCRHEAHPQFGCGLPGSIHAEDIQLLEDMSCNFVRGSHYPQDPAFLDLCDERGICVWVEATGWQHTAEQFADPNFIESQLTNIREMIEISRNHPSVIMWGLQNESHSEDPGCRAGYETLITEIRELDSSRPVTYASNRWPKDICHDLADIISINMYPGWYSGEIEDIGAQLDAAVKYVDESSSAGKPIIISEIGAGAVFGNHDRNHTRWSEEYQARLLDTVISHLFEADEPQTGRVSGLAIWQFCDCRTSQQVVRVLGRPRAFNNKGVVDEYRRPKLAFDVVKRHFESIRGNA